MRQICAEIPRVHTVCDIRRIAVIIHVHIIHAIWWQHLIRIHVRILAVGVMPTARVVVVVW